MLLTDKDWMDIRAGLQSLLNELGGGRQEAKMARRVAALLEKTTPTASGSNWTRKDLKLLHEAANAEIVKARLNDGDTQVNVDPLSYLDVSDALPEGLWVRAWFWLGK